MTFLGSGITMLWKSSRKGGDVRHYFCFLDGDVFWILCAVREILRWIEVREMVDTIVSLTVCAVLLAYLVYAMLRPEKF